jgi:hypothetical protein
MPSYILRNIDPELWGKVAAKATAEGRTLRGLILWLLELYAKGKIPK